MWPAGIIALSMGSGRPPFPLLIPWQKPAVLERFFLYGYP